MDLPVRRLATISLGVAPGGFSWLRISAPEPEGDPGEKQIERERGNAFHLETTVLNSKTTPGGECAVCLDAFRTRQHCRFLPCGHVFHKGCIDRWLRRRQWCPVCRAGPPD
tara:strand:- start:3301 stop:3633 length:333 start_codon:yes stop_codon:yes gene_type:complete